MPTGHKQFASIVTTKTYKGHCICKKLDILRLCGEVLIKERNAIPGRWEMLSFCRDCSEQLCRGERGQLQLLTEGWTRKILLGELCELHKWGNQGEPAAAVWCICLPGDHSVKARWCTEFPQWVKMPEKRLSQEQCLKTLWMCWALKVSLQKEGHQVLRRLLSG